MTRFNILLYFHIQFIIKFIIKKMQQIAQSESLIFDNENNQHNEFMMEYLQYESCPFCCRSFFRGKLTYHLKHCSSQNPMIKSNKPSPRHTKNSFSAATNYERCVNCNSRIPSFLVQKHSQNCSKMSETKMKKSNDTKDSFKNQVFAAEQTIFPKIRNYASQDHAKTSKRIILKSNGPNVIKIRDELRCFRIAEQVQKIQCQHCGRKFSQQASQRHIPICSLLKQKEMKQIVFNKDIKNQTKKQKTKLLGLGKSYEVIQRKITQNEEEDINRTVLEPEVEAEKKQAQLPPKQESLPQKQVVEEPKQSSDCVIIKVEQK